MDVTCAPNQPLYSSCSQFGPKQVFRCMRIAIVAWLNLYDAAVMLSLKWLRHCHASKWQDRPGKAKTMGDSRLDQWSGLFVHAHCSLNLDDTVVVIMHLRVACQQLSHSDSVQRLSDDDDDQACMSASDKWLEAWSLDGSAHQFKCDNVLHVYYVYTFTCMYTRTYTHAHAHAHASFISTTTKPLPHTCTHTSCADLPQPFSSWRCGARWRVAPVVSCLASIKGPGNSLINIGWFVLLEIHWRECDRERGYIVVSGSNWDSCILMDKLGKWVSTFNSGTHTKSSKSVTSENTVTFLNFWIRGDYFVPWVSMERAPKQCCGFFKDTCMHVCMYVC